MRKNPARTVAVTALVVFTVMLVFSVKRASELNDREFRHSKSISSVADLQDSETAILLAARSTPDDPEPWRALAMFAGGLVIVSGSAVYVTTPERDPR